MKIYGVSHIGNSRGNQEDNFIIDKEYLDLFDARRISKDSPSVYLERTIDGGSALLAVSDGMGGHSSGEVASYMAVKYLSDNYSSVIGSDRSALLEHITKLNREVADQSRVSPEYKGMGATLCGVVCRNGSLLGFNAGDSRLYRFDGETLKQLSKDHSEGQRLLDLRLLTEEELKNFPNRKAIYKYVGIRADLVADVFEIDPPSSGTILLLCSDGLCDVLANAEIRDILAGDTSLREKGEALLNVALSRNLGHGDNTTIILTEF